MILHWLASDFREIFERDPEVRVILWFDEKEELRRILVAAEEHLRAEGIDLLRYEPEAGRGQVWLKWNIEAGPKAEAHRIVLWLPFARELLHRAKGSEIRFEAILEYEYSGKVWLVEGKKPTLFLFLRKHGVLLPESRAEQDVLWRGGRDSLLAKYVGKFADRDEAFWRNRITATAIEASLVGDLKEQILLVLADPEGATEDIKRRGLLGELVRDTEEWPPAGCPSVRELAQTFWVAGPTPRAVLVIDALRYDLGQALAKTSAEAQIRHVVAHLPSETFVGMTGLLACPDVRAEVDERGRVRLMSAEAGGDLVQRQVRWLYLRSRYQAESIGASEKPADLAALLDRDAPPKPLPRLLVVMDKEIDGTAHATEQEALHHFDVLLKKLGKAVAKLLRWGYPEVHIVTDHGFVLLGSSLAPGAMTLDKGAAATADARYAILKDGAVADGAILPLSLDPRYRLLLAPGLRAFKDPGRFFHGGATLQEVVIPHVVFRRKMPRSRMRVRPLISETEIRTLTFKVEILPEDPRGEGTERQITLFEEKPLPITVKVFLGAVHAPRSTVKEVAVGPEDRLPLKALVHIEPPLDIGEEIDLHVVDAETDLEFAENVKVRVAREFR